jgi:hypothetical protein
MKTRGNAGGGKGERYAEEGRMRESKRIPLGKPDRSHI